MQAMQAMQNGDLHYPAPLAGSFNRNAENHYLDKREFLMLLDGIVPQKIRPKIF
jgi:hypothetical protein